MRRGRPLRFLVLSLAGWTGARAVLLWPVSDTVAAIAELVGFPQAAAAMLTVAPPSAETPKPTRRPTLPSVPGQVHRRAVAPAHDANEPPLPEPAPPIQATTPAFMPAVARAPSRFAGSIWLLARGGQTTGLLGGQLGASQAGARLTYALGRARKLALSARVAAPLRGSGREAALGIDWQPIAAPIHIIAEQRFALDGGRDGSALFAVGGVGPTDIGRGVRVEAYAQAGIVRRDRVEVFADGAARVTHRAIDLGSTRIDLGLGAWGGAQTAVARVDIGPSIAIATRAGGKPIRLTIDWRERIAGNARPGSGPAISIGSDF